MLDGAARDELTALLDLSEEKIGYPSLSDRALLVIDGDGTVTGTDTAYVLVRLLDSRALVGCALVERRAGAWSVEMAVHPDLRPAASGPRPPGGGPDVVGALVDAALADAASRGGGAVALWERDVERGAGPALVARGLRKTRELLQLRVALMEDAVADAASPPVPVRPFRPGRDEETWLATNRRAFAGHPEQGSWTLEDLRRREGEPWFDAGGFLLHEVDGRLAAFCWTKVHRAPALGEIYVIGVDPDFQGRGLGRALTRAGLGHLAARGISTAMLYVEATNTPALVLYRSLGFEEHHREALFAGEIARVLESGESGETADTPGTSD